MVQASPFSSLEHAILFARDLWFNKSLIQSWLNVFSAQLHIDEAAKFAPRPIMLTRYENSLSIEFDITSREKFIPIERKLARLWKRLS
ncbi:hypothetical protein AHAS_Ahas19G0147300 [Arachis hypogaea]